MSKPNPDFSISLSGSAKPILVIQEYLTDNPETTILFISTIDSQVFLVQVTPSSYKILNQFHMKAPCSSLFYDILTNKCVLGDIHGSIHRYNYVMKKWGQKTTYKETTQQRPEVLYVYIRNKCIYSWNLNSQIIILDQETMNLKNKISLDLDITCGQILRNEKLTNYSACISFANNKPPFIFDCDTGVSILKTYNFCKGIHEDFEEQILIIMQNKLFNDEDCIAVGSSIEKQETRKYYVCIYSIEIEDKFKICQIKIRFQVPLMPIYINLYGKFLSLCMWEYIQILNIQTRDQVCKIKNKQHRWGIILYGQNNEERQIYRFLMSKGFNFWDVQGSSLRMNQLHYKEENLPKPKYIVGSR